MLHFSKTRGFRNCLGAEDDGVFDAIPPGGRNPEKAPLGSSPFAYTPHEELTTVETKHESLSTAIRGYG